MAVPGPVARRHRNRLGSCKILHRITPGVFFQRALGDFFRIAIKHNLSPQTSCVGTDVYQMVGGTHDLLVVLHHYHRVAQRLQLLQHMNQSVGIPRVQTNAGLVENVERTYQRTAQRGTEVDALTLTARERVRESVQRQITQSHVEQELQSACNLLQQSLAHLSVMWLQLQSVEPFLQSHHRHLYQVGNAPAAYLHVVGFGLQARAVTYGACGLSPVSGQHHAVLYLVLILLHHVEEEVNTRALLLAFVAGQSVPQPVLLLLRQVHVRLKYGEVVVGRMPAEPLLPFAHLLAVPAHHAAVVHAQRGIGNHQLFVDAHDLAETLTLRTGTCWRVEREHLVRWFLEGHAVGLELHREVVEDGGRE